jgi:Arc/MetJ family transcription regulator
MSYVRTNVVLDKELVQRAMDRYGFATIRETVDFALRQLVGPGIDVLELHGMGWSGDFEELRGHPLGE